MKILKKSSFMKHTGFCICSMLGGAVLGAALAMFLTPKSGPELRRTLREYLEKEGEKIGCHCHDND